MNDREKVIDGLRHCLPETIIDGLQDCNTCPYQRDCETDATVSLPIRMIEEIRSLLKEQRETELCDRCGRRRIKSNRVESW